MAQSPPGFFFPDFPLPPPTPSWSPPPYGYWWYKPPSGDSSEIRTVAGIFVGLVACLLVGIAVCSLCRRRRNSRARARAAAAAARPQNLTESSSSVRVGERRPGPACAARETAGLPAFTYSLSVKQNVTGGGGEEAATCSVCLAALRLGETVRLLPARLHLYHAGCIDPWLDAHSTCPLCRSDTDPSTG